MPTTYYYVCADPYVYPLRTLQYIHTYIHAQLRSVNVTTDPRLAFPPLRIRPWAIHGSQRRPCEVTVIENASRLHAIARHQRAEKKKRQEL